MTVTVRVSFTVAFILVGDIEALVDPNPLIVIDPLEVTDCPLIVKTTSCDPVGIDAPVVHLIEVEDTITILVHATPATVINVV